MQQTRHAITTAREKNDVGVASENLMKRSQALVVGACEIAPLPRGVIARLDRAAEGLQASDACLQAFRLHRTG